MIALRGVTTECAPEPDTPTAEGSRTTNPVNAQATHDVGHQSIHAWTDPSLEDVTIASAMTPR